MCSILWGWAPEEIYLMSRSRLARKRGKKGGKPAPKWQVVGFQNSYERQYKTARAKVDNYPPNMGFIEEYPLWVVFFKGPNNQKGRRNRGKILPPKARLCPTHPYAFSLPGHNAQN